MKAFQIETHKILENIVANHRTTVAQMAERVAQY